VGQQTKQPETEKGCRISFEWKNQEIKNGFLKKYGLVKGKIWLSMPVFEAYGMTVNFLLIFPAEFQQ